MARTCRCSNQIRVYRPCLIPISFQEVWLSQILISKGWKASVSRESPGKFAPRILSRKILSMKIARTSGCSWMFPSLARRFARTGRQWAAHPVGLSMTIPDGLAILTYSVLYYTILYYTILYYHITHTILCIYYTMLCYAILYYATILCYTILCYTICYTILYYTIHAILYYTILYL